MSIIKKAMIPAMLGLVASGLTANLSHATTLSDLQSQCYLACHDVTVLPSNWVLSLNAVGTPSGKTGDHDLAGWNSTIAAMGDGKCGFNSVGPGGTSRSVAAQFLFDKRATAATPTATTAPTPTATTAPTPTATTAPTPTATTAPTPTSIGPTPTSTTAPTPTATTAPTPTSTTAPTPTATATTPPVGTHTWYDYDYKGGRCFAKDHTIMDKGWCEQHGYKGGGGHNGLTSWDFKLHAHLDYPGQKP